MSERIKLRSVNLCFQRRLELGGDGEQMKLGFDGLEESERLLQEGDRLQHHCDVRFRRVLHRYAVSAPQTVRLYRFFAAECGGSKR